MARPLKPGEWRDQLAVVLERHLARWTESDVRCRERVERAARASIEMNATLAAASRGERVRWSPLLATLLRLGPSGWHRYLRDSRIVERARARVELRRWGLLR